MKNAGKLLTLVLVLALVLALGLPALAAEEPEGDLTRGGFITALYRLAAEEMEPKQAWFEDVPMSGDLALAVRWGMLNGIVKGYGDGRFGPEDRITREQMVTMLYRYAQNLGQGFRGAWMFPLDYPDADLVSDWADEAMHWAVMNGLIQGTDKGLEPRAGATKAQLSQVLLRWQRSVGLLPELDLYVLVNKQNALPESWEAELELASAVNSLGGTVLAERSAYEAYLALKQDLLENDGIEIELDSAYRSVAEQQGIMERFTEKYGAAYAAKYVAQPGYSEHHTGLALDLYFRLDGKDVYHNEDMVQYPELWEKIHARLADHGFILRYPKGMEHITGYAYEPWHIRYIGSPEDAAQIMSTPGLTFEEFLAGERVPAFTLDYGDSDLYTREDMDQCVTLIKSTFAGFTGCSLLNIRYAGDECVTEQDLAWMNDLGGGGYVQVMEFLSDFHHGRGSVVLNEDFDYLNYQWWLARTADGDWELMTWGY